MALYNDIVMDNFLNPKNVGELENPDGTGVYGSPVCGDMMQIQIKVDENDKITDAKFKTFGCGSAIASSSMATSMIIGKSVEEALDLTNKQIIDELGGLPPVKEMCIRDRIYSKEDISQEGEASESYGQTAEDKVNINLSLIHI